MRRLRTSYVDDWEDMEATDNPRFHVLGWSINPIVAVAMMVVGAVVLLVVLQGSSAGWFGDTPWVRWTIAGVCSAGLLGISALSVLALLVMTKYLRRSRIHLARLDGATHEEARAETDRFLWRTLGIRIVIYAALCVGVWVVLGSKLVFEWTSPLTYFGGLGVLVASFVAYAVFGRRIEDALRRFAGNRR